MSRKSKSAVSSEREALTRDVLPRDHAEPAIKPVSIDWDLARVTTVSWGTGTDERLSLNMEQIKRESPEHYEIICELLVLLHKMAQVARNAVSVAAIELGIHEKRGTGPGDKRGAKAKERAQKLHAEDTKLLRTDPSLSSAEVGRILADRGMRGAIAISKKVSAARKK